MSMKKFYVYRTCPCGEMKGIGTASYHLFKGIRYATADRWEAPEEVTSWNGNKQFMHFGDEPCAMCHVPEEHLDNVQKRGKPFPSV